MTVNGLRVFSSPSPVADIVAVPAGTLFFSPSDRGCRHEPPGVGHSRTRTAIAGAYFYSTRFLFLFYPGTSRYIYPTKTYEELMKNRVPASAVQETRCGTPTGRLYILLPGN